MYHSNQNGEELKTTKDGRCQHYINANPKRDWLWDANVKHFYWNSDVKDINFWLTDREYFVKGMHIQFNIETIDRTH